MENSKSEKRRSKNILPRREKNRRLSPFQKKGNSTIFEKKN